MFGLLDSLLLTPVFLFLPSHPYQLFPIPGWAYYNLEAQEGGEEGKGGKQADELPDARCIAYNRKGEHISSLACSTYREKDPQLLGSPASPFFFLTAGSRWAF